MHLVLADLDNTLIDRAGAFRAWAEEFVAARGLPTSAVDRLVTVDQDGQVPRDAVFGTLRREFGVPDPPTELNAIYRRDFVQKFVLEANVREALVGLRGAGVKVVVVTNGPRTQREKITHTGLDAFIDGCVVSEDVGARKPDPRPFEAAARLVGTTLRPEHWMVGDSAEADIGGAAALGLRTIWIRRGRSFAGTGGGPTHVVDSFVEAAERIALSLR